MSQPNVLLICVDHWPGRWLRCAGHPAILTPTLDRLARAGVRFTNAYSATPTCIPARRAMMTGTTAETHGDRIFNQTLEMPDLPNLAQAFSGAGYQTYAVGKMHVYPQRDRVGFDDVILNEEGRHHLGLLADDYELFLAEQGYAGQEFVHGMCNNDYLARPWHLPEYCHPTNWTVREMCRMIKRRDPTRPALWYMSFNFPHPPLVPLAEYLDMYRDIEAPAPFIGDWAADFDSLPYTLKLRADGYPGYSAKEIELARKAFYAQCTHIDHQMRLVLGMLREEKLLDNTIVLFTSDHGDMLGNHGLYAKCTFYEDSAKVPFILLPAAGDSRLETGCPDDRLVELCDVMPTLLDLADIRIPESVEGNSLLSGERRDHLYGEHYENDRATRMAHNGRHKLIYYPVGNHFQLFDLQDDPDELHNLADEPACREIREDLSRKMISHLYGDDLKWLGEGKLKGLPDKAYVPHPGRDLNGQRGWRFM